MAVNGIFLEVKMHIFMLVSAYQEKGYANTGAELQAETQLRQLKAKGHKITIISKKRTFKSKFYEVIDGVEVFRVWPPSLRTLETLSLLFLARNKCDIVHIHGQHLFSVAAIGLCRLLGIPSVLKITIAGRFFVRLSADRIFPRKWRPLRRLLNYVSQKASAYLAISKEISEQMPQIGFLPERIHLIPNGVNMGRFHPVASSEQRLLREQLGLPTDKQILLYASRLMYRKGVDLLIAAWPLIHANCPEACLVVVGGGSLTEVEKLKKLKKTGEDSIIYAGEVQDTAPYLQCSDVFIFPSRKEGLPNALLEAMACGVACIASDIGGCNELIQPDKTGILFASGDSTALSKAAVSLLCNQQKIQEIGIQAYHHIQAKYNILMVTDQINGLYTTLHKKVSVQGVKSDSGLCSR